MPTRRHFALFAFALALFSGCASSSYDQTDAGEAQSLVDKANGSLGAFLSDPEMQWFKEETRGAKGIMIVPSLVRGGYVLGGSGGSGVLMARGVPGEGWSDPSFHSMGSVTFGFQIGGEISELVLLVMTDDAMDALLSPNFRFGGDISVAAGPVGQGAKAQVADIMAYSRSKGLYAGINIEGARMQAREDLNAAYYGAGARPRDILISRTVRNEGADQLRGTMSTLDE